MTTRNLFIVLGALLVVTGGYFLFTNSSQFNTTPIGLDATPRTVTLSGTYVCLPHIDPTGPQTDECAFGLQSDNGDYYAVNFGASASAMEQFTNRAHITAEGFVVIKEALNSDHWAQYNMKGIFTITKMIEPAPIPQGRLNINVICESALTYMTFSDGASSDAFVAECKEGKHPEVIEHYKTQMNLGDGVAI